MSHVEDYFPDRTRRIKPAAQTRLKSGPLADWEADNPVLANGEPGYVSDLKTLRIGDGVSPFSDLSDINLTEDQVNTLDARLTSLESDHATAAQGALADTAVQPSELTDAVNGLVDAAPGALDTLNELAAALGDDANFAATVTTAISAETTARSNADTALEDSKYDKANLTSWPTYLYGNSYGILSAVYFTSGNHYSQQVANELDGGTVTSYAISGKRILDVLSALINQTAFQALVTAPVAGSKWPGTSSRSGLTILESSFNDCGHYSTMVGTAIPVAISGTVYRNAMKSAYRTALSLMSSETRIEAASWTTSGTWTRGSVSGYASGGLVDFTTANAAYSEVSVTPPQRGPLAGKVFIHGFNVATGTGTMAAVNITVDGGAPTAYTPPPWESYTGPGGGNVIVGADVIPVTVPIDGAAHTVRVAHNGSAGHLLYVDFMSIPSEDPNPVAVMGCELGPVVGSVWNASQVAIFRANMLILLADIRSVVSEFPNAFYVPSTMTSNGLYSADGVHPNDRGMAQRAADLLAALQTLKPRLDSRALSLTSDGSFGVV